MILPCSSSTRAQMQNIWVIDQVSRWLDIGQVLFLSEQAWSIKDLLYGFRGNFSCGTRRVVPSRQDSSILPARVANHSAGFDHLARSRSLPYNKTGYCWVFKFLLRSVDRRYVCVFQSETSNSPGVVQTEPRSRLNLSVRLVIIRKRT